MRTIHTRKEDENMVLIRTALQEDGVVEVVNEYETFYGTDFDRWLKNGLKDMDCTFEVLSWCKWYNYPWDYKITLNAI